MFFQLITILTYPEEDDTSSHLTGWKDHVYIHYIAWCVTAWLKCNVTTSRSLDLHSALTLTAAEQTEQTLLKPQYIFFIAVPLSSNATCSEKILAIWRNKMPRYTVGVALYVCLFSLTFQTLWGIQLISKLLSWTKYCSLTADITHIHPQQQQDRDTKWLQMQQVWRFSRFKWICQCLYDSAYLRCD